MLLERVSEIDHHPSVTSIAVDPRGRYLLTGGPISAQLWWAASGEPVRAMKQGSRGRAVFAAGGRLVVTTGPTLWDVETGDRVARPEGPATDEVLAIDADGARVLTRDGGTLSLWAVPAFEKLWSIGNCEDGELGLANEPDEDDGEPAPVAAPDDGEQELFRIHSAEFHAGGERIVTAGYVSGARPAVADRVAADGRILRRFTVEREVFAIALDGESRLLLGVFEDAHGRMVRMVSLDSGVPDPRSAGAPDTGRGSYAIVICVVPGSTHAVVGGRNGELSVLDLAAGGSRVLTTQAHDGWISALDFLPDGRLVSAGGYDGRVVFWRLAVP